MKVAVTGANGHVGANLVRKLMEEGHRVRVMQHRHHNALDGLDAEVIHGDLLDPGSLNNFCSGMEVVFHLAARISIGHNSFDSLHQTNVDGTKNILQAARTAGVKRFIHFSSIHVFQHKPSERLLDENSPRVIHTRMPYERTKAIAEEWVLQQHSDDFKVTVINPTAIVGPNDYQPSFTGQFLISLYKGNLPGLVRGGYNFVDVRDVCDAAIRAIKQGRSGQQYILSGNYHTVLEVAELMQQTVGKRISKRLLPAWLAYLGIPFIYLWSKGTGQQPLYTSQSLEILRDGNRNIINGKARKELDFNPRPLSETIIDTINWFKEHQYLDK